jgi:hypothetical protein
VGWVFLNVGSISNQGVDLVNMLPFAPLGRLWARGAAAAALVLSLATSLVAGPFENAIPSDTVVLVNMPNVALMKERMGQTSIANMLNDEAMKPFVDNLMGEVQLLLDTAEQITSISLTEFLSLPTGQVSMAVRMDAENSEAFPFIYFLADCKGNEEKLKDIMTKITSALEENGLSKEMVGDVSVYAIGDAAKRQQIAMAVKGSLLAIGNDPESMNKVIGSIESGSDESLGKSERFMAFRERAGGTGHMEIYADLVRTIEFASDMGQPEIATAVAMLGLNAFESLGVSALFGEDDNDHSVQVLVNTKGTSPIFNLFKMPAKPIKPEAWVPADVAGYGSFNWDVDTFYETLIGMVNAVQPGAMEQVEAMLAGPDPQNPLLNLKNDLIGPLGNRISFINDYIVEESTPNPRFLLAWELENSQKLTELFDRLMTLAGGALPLETTSVNGNTVYTFPLGDLVAAQVDPSQMPFKLGVFGFTITKTHLMLTTHVELLNKCLNTNSGGLAESEIYSTLAKKMPAEVSMMGVSRRDEDGKATWTYLKSGKLAETIRTAMESQSEVGAFLGGIIDALDGSNLPEFEKVQKYFIPSGSYAIMDDKGVKYMSFTPKQ